MAAFRPPGLPAGGGNPDQPPPVRSFAAVVSSGSESVATGSSFDPGVVSTYRGEPALRISKQEILQLAEPYRNALVGRFPYSRPPMDMIRKFISFFGTKG